LNTKEAFKAAIDGRRVQQPTWGNMYICFTPNKFMLKGDKEYGEEYSAELTLEFEDDTEWKLYSPPPKFKVGEFVSYDDVYCKVVAIAEGNVYSIKWGDNCKLQTVEESRLSALQC